MDYLKRAWALVHIDRILENYDNFKKAVGGTEVMCVVKADCYGHGDRLIAPALENHGVKWFAVSNIEEAIRLRDEGIKGEILILGYTPCECAERLIEYNIIQTVTELKYAEKLNASAKSGAVRVHIAIDTGMTRIGLFGEIPGICEQIKKINTLENIKTEGMFTHLAVADSNDDDDKNYTKMQIEKICSVNEHLKSDGINLEQVHFLNSAGGAEHYDKRSTLARLGIILYGLYPDVSLNLGFEPKAAMEIKAAVAQVKEIGEGIDISYGRTYTTNKPTKIATVTIGYADGFPRAMSNKGYVLIKGRKAPVVGRVCMDQIMCDVTGIDVQEGDEAVIMGKSGEFEITADTIAQITGTIGYEIVCQITQRVPRIYIK